MKPMLLKTIRNIRDLGGMSTADGRRILPRRLIRSAHLGSASEDDLQFLRNEENLAAVLDLRTNQERLEKPDHADGFTCFAIPVIDDLRAGITHEKGVEEKEFPDMAFLYRLMVTRPETQAGFARALHQIFTWDYSQGAILWHCTEGKDRCGMTAALVLEALGVSRDTIMRDYLETNRTSLLRARGVYERLLPLRGEVFARSVYRAYVADERYLRAAWDAMGENYLTDTLHISQAEIDAFRAQVLTA
ncbi:MAG: tyrosine-protein phosphatase [Clostridia bacterium]|nr:tyrosine-protein phosphatase [Clostridia bacterium]